MNSIKKVLCVALVLVLLFASVPAIDVSELGFGMTASALNATGKCGKTATYTFDSATGRLTIEGTGKINAEAFYNNYYIRDVVIGDSITEIGADAFNNCDYLTSVDLGNTVTVIGDKAFYDCYNLTSIDIPDSVITIGVHAFYNCYSLTSVTIGDSVTTIGNYAFQYCDSLTSVIIPDSVVTIGYSAFLYCNNLASVVIGNGVTTIGGHAFAYCENLTSVTIGKNVKEISDAFLNCTSLESINIPKTVTYIGSEAFRYCPSLYDVYYEGSEAEWNAISIGANNTGLENATIHFGEAMPECQHEYVWVAGILSTCINLGVRGHYQCQKCGKFFKNDADKTETTLEELTIPLDLANHEGFTKEVEGTKTPATCVATGSVKMECACGDRKTVTLDIDNTAHDLDTLKKLSDTEHGEPCKREGCTYVADKAAHDYATTVNKVLPTCVTEGSETKKCACGAETTETLPVNDNHNWGTAVKVEATCTEDEMMVQTCSRCNQKYVKKTSVKALGHSYGSDGKCKNAGCTETCPHSGKKETIYGKPATCTNPGVSDGEKCKDCGVVTKIQTVIPALGHTFKDYKSDGNATCIKDGTMTATCEICKTAKDTKTEVGSKERAGHTPDTDGIRCTLCGVELVCVHVYSKEKLITKTPTCTVEGQKAIVCSKCNANKPGSEEVIPATGHAWDEGEVIKAATCNEAGAKKFKCNNKCGETKTEEILATGNHTYSEDKLITITPTCTSEGKKAIVCTNCGEKKSGTEEVIPATHNYPDKWSVVIAPDCQNTGFAVKVCFDCHEVIAMVVPKAGHADLDGDSKCDTCEMIFVVEPEEPTDPDTPNEPEEKPCDCDCHAGGIKAFFFNFLNFFAKLFDKSARVCKCGASH